VVAIVVDRVAFGQSLAWIQVLGAALILLAAAGVNLGWRIVPQKRFFRHNERRVYLRRGNDLDSKLIYAGYGICCAIIVHIRGPIAHKRRYVRFYTTEGGASFRREITDAVKNPPRVSFIATLITSDKISAARLDGRAVFFFWGEVFVRRWSLRHYHAPARHTRRATISVPSVCSGPFFATNSPTISFTSAGH
jgi:hypothetical protein